MISAAWTLLSTQRASDNVETVLALQIRADRRACSTSASAFRRAARTSGGSYSPRAILICTDASHVRVCLSEERQRLVIAGAGRIGDPIGSGVPDLPAAGGELPQPAPRLALARAVLLLRRAHHALRWTLVDGSGPPRPFVPLAPDGGRNPRDPADSRPVSKLRRARRGTTSGARLSRIPLGVSPRLH